MAYDTYRCPQGHVFHLPTGAIGREIECPNCGFVFLASPYNPGRWARLKGILRRRPPSAPAERGPATEAYDRDLTGQSEFRRHATGSDIGCFWTVWATGFIVSIACAFLTGVVYLVLAVFSPAHRYDWQPARGTVLEARFDPRPGGRHVGEILYRYEVQGREYRGRERFERRGLDDADLARRYRDEYPVGRYIRVFYNPADPAASGLTRQESKAKQAPALLLWSLLAAGMVTLFSFVFGQQWYLALLWKKLRAILRPGRAAAEERPGTFLDRTKEDLARAREEDRRLEQRAEDAEHPPRRRPEPHAASAGDDIAGDAAQPALAHGDTAHDAEEADDPPSPLPATALERFKVETRHENLARRGWGMELLTAVFGLLFVIGGALSIRNAIRLDVSGGSWTRGEGRLAQKTGSPLTTRSGNSPPQTYVRAFYIYSVRSRRYVAEDTIPEDGYRIGKTIPVYYDRRDPWRASLSPPAFAGSVPLLILAILMAAAGLGWLWIRWRFLDWAPSRGPREAVMSP